MSQALSELKYILLSLIDFVFNRMYLTSDQVTVGWVLVVCIVFGILIGSLLAVPKMATNVRRRRD